MDWMQFITEHVADERPGPEQFLEQLETLLEAGEEEQAQLIMTDYLNLKGRLK